MAEPVLSASLLTPISIRLTWTYTGSADFEVFWKSDHPAGQEYVLLGRTSGNTYDVGSLSWTTTYYFKVRAVSGATYGDFSNEVNLFVCCGQAVATGNPPVVPPGEEVPPTTVTKVDFWQQAADPGDGEVAFVAKDIPHQNIYLWVYEGGEWYYRAQAAYEGTFMPVAVRKAGDRIAVYDINDYFGWAGWYWFSFFNGTTWRSSAMPHSMGDFSVSREWSEKSLPYSMEFNDNGRIVVARCYIDWDDDTWDPLYYPAYTTLAISNDFGLTWGSEIVISTTFGQYQYKPEVAIAEDGAFNIWIANVVFDHLYHPAWTNPEDVFALYKIYKYNGTSATLIRTITTLLKNTWGPGPYYTQTGWATLVRNCKIYAEGSKIAVCYVYDFTMTGTPPGSYYGNAIVKVDVSDDYGATWETHEVTIPSAGSIGWDPSWDDLIPSICISDGDLLVYLLKGTTAANQVPVILKSTDNGATWTLAYNFPIYSMAYPWVMQLRSDGDHVTATSCGSALSAGGALALWESLDGGDSWTAREIVPAVEPQILVPA